MAELIEDELAFLTHHVPVAGRTVLDIGCGAGAATRRLVQQLGAACAIGVEVDEKRVHENNMAGNPDGVTFVAGRAERLPFPDSNFDIALMQKSFHHVPVASMDVALNEAARVLKADNGVLVVSEPVAAGPFDEIMRTFHDEHVERAAAQEALARCEQFSLMETLVISTPISFDTFDQFVARMMSPAVTNRSVTSSEIAAARAIFGSYANHERLSLERDFLITILRQPSRKA